MRFLVDHQLPPALARWLTDRHCPSTHTNELGLDAADDRDIWSWACAEGLIVVSKDEDFFALANWQGDAGRLLWIRIGNCRRADLLRRMEICMAADRGGVPTGAANRRAALSAAVS